MSCVYLFRSLENVSQNSGGWLNVVGVFDKSCPKQRVSHADFSSGVYVVRLDPGSGRVNDGSLLNNVVANDGALPTTVVCCYIAE